MWSGVERLEWSGTAAALPAAAAALSELNTHLRHLRGFLPLLLGVVLVPPPPVPASGAASALCQQDAEEVALRPPRLKL